MSTSYTWQGISGDWNNANDWTPSGGPPTSSDLATINGTSTDTITVDTADVANSLILDDQNATEFACDYVRSEFSITPGKITTIQYA